LQYRRADQGHGDPRRRERLSARDRGFLYRHPKIQDVQVIGVPDPRYGEELCAWVKLRDGERAAPEEIQEFCKGQIAHYKIPRYIRFVDTFPMTVTGKIQKFLMREETIRELGLIEQKTA
jgi:fatty-acyl-CoA synthase